MSDWAKIEAFIEISEVKARYCRALDTKDWAGFADVFAEDVVFDMSQGGSGPPPIQGRDNVLRFVRPVVEKAVTAHHVHGPEITVEGDVAHVIWAMKDRVVWDPDHKLRPDAIGHTGYGHYHERYERKGGRWRIAALRLSYLQFDLDYDAKQ
jgi:uncharacterized protein (TIGR02246 family)